MAEQVNLAERFFEHFNFPEATYNGFKVKKKTITDNVSLTSADKLLIKDALKSLIWRYGIKPETAHIPAFEDSIHEYIEIAVLHVEVKNHVKTKQLCTLLHKQIMYPTILVLENQDCLALSIADKRINQADSNKLTIESQLDTGWISPDTASTDLTQDFLADLTFQSCSTASLYDFYCSLITKFTRYEAGKSTGRYNAENDKQADELSSLVAELQSLESELKSIRNKLKKEVQMNEKMRLIVQERKVKQANSAITSQLV